MNRKTWLAILVIGLLFLSVVPRSTGAVSQHEEANDTGQLIEEQTSSLYLPLIAADIPPIIPDTTVVLDDSALDDLISVSPDGTEFTFDENSPILDDLDPNDIMVGDVDSTVPNGFLRKVASISQEPNGSIVVTTVDGSLEEAIQQGSVSAGQTLSPDDVVAMTLAEGVRLEQRPGAPDVEFYIPMEEVVLYDGDGNPSTTNDQIVANGSLTLVPSYDFRVVVRGWQVKTVRFSTQFEETADLEISAEVQHSLLDHEVEIAEFYLTPITVFIGWVPIVLMPSLEVTVGVDGSVKVGVSTRVTQDATYLSGLQYENGSWQPIEEFSNAFSHTPPTLSGSFDLRGYAAAGLALRLYGVAGPQIDAEAYLKLDADPSATPWWELYGGLNVIAKVQMKLLSHVIASYEESVIAFTFPIASAPTGMTTRVSVASDGTQGDYDSYGFRSMSPDGRYVAFWSRASNLVSGDTNGRADIFVHDRQTATTTRVSVASDGTQGNNDAEYYPSISADGRFVAFESRASNLIPNDTNQRDDIFVHDRQSGEITRVSVASDGTQSNSSSLYASISADGRYVAFNSHASNLVPGDTNGDYDIFVHDRQIGETTRVSVASDGTQGNDISWSPSLSYADGRYVAFESRASNLVPNDTNQRDDIFVHDRQTGDTTRVSVASDGAQGSGFANRPFISTDGRYVSFDSTDSNLVGDDTNGYDDIFVHDRQIGETTRVSIASDGTQGNWASSLSSISADGRFVAFESKASNLVGDDTNGSHDIFVHDRQTGETTRISIASDGTQGNSASSLSLISADGHYVMFASQSSNLVPGDTNGKSDVFVHERGAELRRTSTSAE